VYDKKSPVKQYTGYVVWVLGKDITSKDAVEDKSWVRQRTRLYSLWQDAACVRCIGLSQMKILDVVV